MPRGLVARGVLVVTLAGLGVSSAVAGTRESVRAILTARDFMPLTAEAWRKLGPGVEGHLMEAADDTALTYGARERAMTALATTGGLSAREFLRKTVERPKISPQLLSAALESYGRGFGRTDPSDVLLLSVPLLGNPDWGVRQSAARALGEVRTKEATTALRDRQTKETHPAVLHTLRDAIERSGSGNR